MLGSQVPEAQDARAARPAWLREFLLSRTGPTHVLTLKIEPFVAWLGVSEPASVDPALLVDLYGFWTTESGAKRTRATLEVVRDLYEWLREQGVDGAGQLCAITDDWLAHRLPDEQVEAVARTGPGLRLRGGLADVLAACGVMLISVVLVAGGWLMSSPATIVAGSGFGPVLPLVAGLALGAGFLLGGYVLLLRAVRGLGKVSARTGWTVIVGVGLLSIVFCIVGVAGALEMMSWGSIFYALPFIVFAVAGTFGAVFVTQALLPIVRAVTGRGDGRG